MRKTNNLPWIGRTVATAIMVLGSLGVLAGSAAAQTTVYDYDDYEAWWDSFECTQKKNLLLPTAAETTDAAHEARVCVGSADLAPQEEIIISSFIQATPNGPFENNKAWWNDANQTPAFRQALAGYTSIGDASRMYVAPAAVTTVGNAALDFNDAYDDLRQRAMIVVNKSGDALSGRAMMTDDEEDDMGEAPALPLVGIGILGLLLAGRIDTPGCPPATPARLGGQPQRPTRDCFPRNAATVAARAAESQCASGPAWRSPRRRRRSASRSADCSPSISQRQRPARRRRRPHR